jgi:pimeloyl-ACP methyl ester carboxylesterase
MISQSPTMQLESGRIAYRDSGGKGMPILFVHGLCGSKEVFEHQFVAPLTDLFRLIAFDLPGHGASDDARDPRKSYSVDALTRTTVDVMNYLRLERALVVGWSLGGHIALEMIDRFPERLAGVAAVGAPPVGRGWLAPLRAFRMRSEMLLARKAVFSTRDAERWQRLCYGPEADGMHFAAILRADGRVRTETNRSFQRGGTTDQRRTVETSRIPLAMINGADDPIVRRGYLDTVAFSNLWEKQLHAIEGAGHTPFLSHPNSFNVLLLRFASDMSRRFRNQMDQDESDFTLPETARAAAPRSRQRAAR